MLSGLFKIVVIIVVLGAVGYFGLSIWAGACSRPDTSQPDMPDVEDVGYSFYIKNTGGLILSDDFEQHGEEAGSRIYVLHGFWEMRGNKFKYMAGDIVLNEAIFGEIVLKRRGR